MTSMAPSIESSLAPSPLVSGRSARPPLTGVAGADRLPSTRAADSPLHDARMWDALLGGPALASGEVAALASVARARTVAAGEVVFTHDETANALVFVREGDVALGYRNADGEFRIERPVRGPGWLDQSAAWLDGKHVIDARTTTQAVVVELPRNLLEPVLRAHPDLSTRLIASLAGEVRSLAVNTHGLMHKDAPARFAQWLVERFQPTADSPRRGVVKLGERKRDIASQLAITPETLSRLMRSLTRQGLINVAGYTVHVADIDGLKRVAEGE
jgi:CRP/FNR family transcriptional regulator, dissimilatory nitrate respiration regulator